MKNKWKAAILVFIGVVIGALSSILWYSVYKGINHQAINSKEEKKIKYWVAPMDPNYRRDKPGKSPMGMDLVPVYEEATNDKNTIKISPTMINNLGVVTQKVRFEKMSREIKTVGYVAADEDNIENVHAYIDGWVRKLKVTSVGDVVKKGQTLFKLYSPSLVNAQQEFILAINNQNRQLIEAGRKKLLTLGLNQEQIQFLERNKKAQQEIDVYSNINGIVSKLNIRDGMYIKPDNELMVIEDLSTIWIRVEVLEKQSDWVKVGQTAIASFIGLPQKQWQGEVIYVYPTLDKTTHTLAVRLKFPNPNFELKPNMYASVKILVPSSEESTVIPSSAVIMTEKGNRVIVALGDGRFQAKSVSLGEESGGKTIVLNGLKPGEDVVVSGQFLIDSESNLNAAFNRLSELKPKTMHHNHHDMTMSKNKPLIAKILDINTVEHQITISHMPIKSLGMPEMVMALPVDKKISLSGFKVNDLVEMKLLAEKPSHYKVIEMKPAQKVGP